MIVTKQWTLSESSMLLARLDAETLRMLWANLKKQSAEAPMPATSEAMGTAEALRLVEQVGIALAMVAPYAVQTPYGLLAASTYAEAAQKAAEAARVTGRACKVIKGDLPEPEPLPAECEHGLSAALCAGPMHYPADEPGPMATMSDAHAEWHRNAGVPMGTPGCPQDACHYPDEGPYDEEPEPPAPEPAPAYVRRLDWSTIPVGAKGKAYYALEVDGTTRFYRIERPTKGKWAGYTFLTVQAGDDFHRVLNPAPLLNRLVAEHAEAAARYGAEIGACSRCNRTLTDETSRALGIGPDCRKKG